MKKTLLISALLIASPMTTQAALILATITASETFGGAYTATTLDDQATTSTDLIALTQYGTTGWLSNNNAGVGGEMIVHDFGSVVSLDTLYLWNWNRTQDHNGFDRGVKAFSVAISNDNVSYTDVGSFTATVEAAGYSGDTIAAQSFDIGDQTARYARLTVVSNHGQANIVGIEEMHYENVTPVPEPSASALLGLAGLGLLVRRRR